ncbi:unnamed protein product [Clonostachys rhizophaga]|uniref:Uncharacterized protein n=2 Tax=Clonostachys TaxID=110564 RepID=A0A9N9V7Y3_9HYPO|nr:unnamed protein product [Clonostachys byssicola]CAH0017712.1 unnamed protein product [Clonostachys rhizophaga]
MLQPQIRRKPLEPGPPSYAHSRTRTTSSNVFPAQPGYPMQQAPIPQHLAQPIQQHSRRSSSVNTISTSSSIPPPAAYRQNSVSDLQRSGSNRSGGATSIMPQGGGYVALLRKQKATVWCDRAQYEDPRLTAQQRAAKKRANLEVVRAGSRTSTGMSSAKAGGKVRAHAKNQVVGLTPGENHVGVGGVPLRLLATEAEGESSDDEPMARSQHRRTNSSGRNSIASGRRGIPYRTSGGHGSFSGKRQSPNDTPERSGSLVDDRPASIVRDDAASGKARSTHSGSSAERADNVAELSVAPRLAANSLMHATLTREKSVKNPEELRRRGSVDERTSTLTSQRLYIANPD